MYYVYLVKSLKNNNKTYIGYTNNLKKRIKKHNSGESVYASDFKPWKLISFVGFDDKNKALKFEKYLKIGSGYAFAKKHFW